MPIAEYDRWDDEEGDAFSDENNDVQDRIVAVLNELIASGITQKEIATRVGMSPALISKIVNGHRKSGKLRKALVLAFNVNEA